MPRATSGAWRCMQEANFGPQQACKSDDEFPDFEAKNEVKATKNNVKNIANTPADVAKTFQDIDNVANVAKTGARRVEDSVR